MCLSPTFQSEKKFLEAYASELDHLGRKEKLVKGELYLGLVRAIDHEAQRIRVVVGPHDAVLPLAAMRWARKVDPEQWFEGSLLSSIPKSFKKGDVLLRVDARDYEARRNQLRAAMKYPRYRMPVSYAWIDQDERVWILREDGDGYRMSRGRGSVYLFPGQLKLA